MGAPPAAFDHGGPPPVDTEEIRSMPEDVKQYASDQELVAIYCAMTKWKSGDFFLGDGCAAEIYDAGHSQSEGAGC